MPLKKSMHSISQMYAVSFLTNVNNTFNDYRNTNQDINIFECCVQLCLSGPLLFYEESVLRSFNGKKNYLDSFPYLNELFSSVGSLLYPHYLAFAGQFQLLRCQCSLDYWNCCHLMLYGHWSLVSNSSIAAAGATCEHAGSAAVFLKISTKLSNIFVENISYTAPIPCLCLTLENFRGLLLAIISFPVQLCISTHFSSIDIVDMTKQGETSVPCLIFPMI